VRLGVKFYPKPSAFKQALGNMERGDLIYGAQLAGDFTLPRNPETKLAFLAGGIGITPFRSMLQYLIDHNERRPVVVLYANERARDIAYRDVLDQAERKLAIRTHYAVASGAAGDHYAGYIDRAFIEKAIPDFTERMFYVSGPQAMVQAVKRTLLGMGVHRSRIKVDFFPGFA
jgi:ferredoxin-NADP reductase